MRVVRRVVAALSSYALASALFLFLLLLTYLGTLDQVEHGLLHAQQKYFHSFIAVHDVKGIPLPLPGAYLLLVLLFANVLLGMLVRMRRTWAQAGMWMVHGGILLLLVGSFVNFHFADGGYITLFEGASADYFESFEEWEVVVQGPEGKAPARTVLLPGSSFMTLRPGEAALLQLDGLPFALELSGYMPNAWLMRIDAGASPTAPVAEGHFLEQLEVEQEQERNAAGLYARVIPNDAGRAQPRFCRGRRMGACPAAQANALALHAAAGRLPPRSAPGHRHATRLQQRGHAHRGRTIRARAHRDERAHAASRLHLLSVVVGTAERRTGGGLVFGAGGIAQSRRSVSPLRLHVHRAGHGRALRAETDALPAA